MSECYSAFDLGMSCVYAGIAGFALGALWVIILRRMWK